MCVLCSSVPCVLSVLTGRVRSGQVKSVGPGRVGRGYSFNEVASGLCSADPGRAGRWQRYGAGGRWNPQLCTRAREAWEGRKVQVSSVSRRERREECAGAGAGVGVGVGDGGNGEADRTRKKKKRKIIIPLWREFSFKSPWHWPQGKCNCHCPGCLSTPRLHPPPPPPCKVLLPQLQLAALASLPLPRQPRPLLSLGGACRGWTPAKHLIGAGGSGPCSQYGVPCACVPKWGTRRVLGTWSASAAPRPRPLDPLLAVLVHQKDAPRTSTLVALFF